MCGLAGCSGVKPDINKLRLLAILNRSRGTDSCGIFYSGYTYKGVGAKSDSLDFFIEYQFKKFRAAGNCPTLIHTRAKTEGYANLENAHPFEYYVESADPEKNFPNMVFTHNGVIRGRYDLAQKYKVDYSDYKVDSKQLGDIIFKYGFDVLTKYRGMAALAFTYMDDDDRPLFLWKGASKKTEKGAIEEERPLHYYYDKKDKTIYYSSEKIHLECISNQTADVQSVPNNTLLKIVNGEIVHKTVFDRSEVEPWPTTTYKETSSDYDYWGRNYGRKKDNNKSLRYFNQSYSNNIGIVEDNPQNRSKGRVYLYNGLYWTNGHLLTGKVHIDLSDQKRIYLSEKEKPGKDVIEAYFRDGVWLKDKKTFESYLNSEGHTIFAGDAREDTLLRNRSDGKMYYNKRAANGEVIPMFSYFRYQFKDGHLMGFIPITPILDEEESDTKVLILPPPKNRYDKLLESKNELPFGDPVDDVAVGDESEDWNEYFVADTESSLMKGYNSLSDEIVAVHNKILPDEHYIVNPAALMTWCKLKLLTRFSVDDEFSNKIVMQYNDEDNE